MSGLVGLVTGAASGLGRATVQRLLSKGTARAITAIDLNSIPDNSSDSLLPISNVDISNEKSVQDALNKTMDRFGRLDFVVNCAGIGLVEKTFDFRKGVPHSLESFSKVLNVNVIGTFNVSRLATGLIYKNEPDVNSLRGCIINIASIAAFEGQIGQAAYAASKGAVVSMTLTIARDLGKVGIRCVTIAPGVIDTPLLAKVPEKARKYLESLVVAPNRLGKPDEIAQTVQSVLENPYINGETIRVDGGLRMPPI